MTQHPNGDAYTIATTDGRGDITVLAQVEHHDLTSPSTDLARTGDRMLLLAAVARQIVCPFTDTVLDVHHAVLVSVPGSRCHVMNADHWDAFGPDFLAARPNAEVIDGRALWTPPHDYAAACQRAADAQGVTAITAALSARGITAEVWQTGGFCMVAVVRIDVDRLIGMTDEGKTLAIEYTHAQWVGEDEVPDEHVHQFEDLADAVAWVAERTAQAPAATAEAAHQVSDLTDLFGPVIHSYTRAQAIADGVLHDASTDAREAGFRYPLALTDAAWQDAVAWTESNRAMQDESGRLWDVLTMAQLTDRAVRNGARRDRVAFKVLRIPNTPRATAPLLTTLVLHIGPGDDGEPVATIMLPDED